MFDIVVNYKNINNRGDLSRRRHFAFCSHLTTMEKGKEQVKI